MCMCTLTVQRFCSAFLLLQVGYKVPRKAIYCLRALDPALCLSSWIYSTPRNVSFVTACMAQSDCVSFVLPRSNVSAAIHSSRMRKSIYKDRVISRTIHFSWFGGTGGEVQSRR